MSGLALLKIIRRENDFSDIPFFLTDSAFTKVKVLKAGQTGVTGLFVIPYDETGLTRKLSLALEKKEDPVIHKLMETMDNGLQLIEKKEYNKALEVFTILSIKKRIRNIILTSAILKHPRGNTVKPLKPLPWQQS